MAAVFLTIGAVGPVAFSFNADDTGVECAGSGGVVRWYLHDRSQVRADLETLRRNVDGHLVDELEMHLVSACDKKAGQQILTSVRTKSGDENL